MTLLPNQFAITTLVGTKISGTNVITVEFYSASAADVITPGEAVVACSTVKGLVTKVAASTALTDLYLGFVLTNPLKDSYAVGDKLEIACVGDIVTMTASAVVTAGAKLQYDYSTMKVATQTGSNTVLGMALENAAADGDLIRVFINPTWMVSTGEANTYSSLGTAVSGVEVIGTKSGADLRFKRLLAGTGMAVDAETSDVKFTGIDTFSSLGTAAQGSEIIGTKVGADFRFKRILAGTGLAITEGSNGITIYHS